MSGRKPKARGEGAPVVDAGPDEKLAFVVPDVVGMLKKAKVVIGVELDMMLEAQSGGGMADATGGKIRNLVAALSSLQGTEKEALKDLGSASGLSPRQLAKVIREELRALEAEIGGDDE